MSFKNKYIFLLCLLMINFGSLHSFHTNPIQAATHQQATPVLLKPAIKPQTTTTEKSLKKHNPSKKAKKKLSFADIAQHLPTEAHSLFKEKLESLSEDEQQQFFKGFISQLKKDSKKQRTSKQQASEGIKLANRQKTFLTLMNLIFTLPELYAAWNTAQETTRSSSTAVTPASTPTSTGATAKSFINARNVTTILDIVKSLYILKQGVTAETSGHKAPIATSNPVLNGVLAPATTVTDGIFTKDCFKQVGQSEGWLKKAWHGLLGTVGALKTLGSAAETISAWKDISQTLKTTLAEATTLPKE